VAISRERAVDLSHRIGERLATTPGVSVLAEREFARNRILQALLEWNRELGLLEGQARTRVHERNQRVVEGTQEWDLLFVEEMTRALAGLLGRGE